MKLSLSTRIAESSSAKDRAEMAIEALAPAAKTVGFAGLSMRASQLSIGSPGERVDEVARLLDAQGLAVSMVMGNVALAANTAEAPDVLRHIAPHLDLAERLGCKLVRVMLHHHDDVAAAQRAADEAAERGMSLAQQTHWGTPCETVEQTLDVVARVDRRNFGITFEPANLLACGEADVNAAVQRLAPHIVNFYYQNVRLDEGGSHRFATRARGAVAIRYVPLDAPSDIPAGPMIERLGRCGYDGWVTVHQPLREGQTVPDAIAEAARVFGPLVNPLPSISGATAIQPGSPR